MNLRRAVARAENEMLLRAPLAADRTYTGETN